MHRLYTEDTTATAIAIRECDKLQSTGYTAYTAHGCCEGKHEHSFVLETTDFHLLVGVACTIVYECGQKEVWLVDSNSIIWIVSNPGNVLQCINTETGEDYNLKSLI